MPAAFRRAETAQDSSSGSPESPPRATQGVAARRRRRPRAFAPYITPSTVEELFATADLQLPFSRSLVFLHNKRPAADRLLRLGEQCRVANFSSRSGPIDPERLLNEIVASRAPRGSQRDTIVVTATGQEEQVRQVVLAVANARYLRTGLWVRGHVDQFSAPWLRMFDAHFFFDMAGAQVDVLRSAIPIPDSVVDELRKGVGLQGDGTELALAFLALNTKRVGLAPRLTLNPALLRLT